VQTARPYQYGGVRCIGDRRMASGNSTRLGGITQQRSYSIGLTGEVPTRDGGELVAWIYGVCRWTCRLGGSWPAGAEGGVRLGCAGSFVNRRLAAGDVGLLGTGSLYRWCV
jgi:hypothetical protein